MFKAKARVIACILGVASVAAILSLYRTSSNAVAEECAASPCNTTFQVNVKETLSVSITPDFTDNTGEANDFLRNKINLSVTSNNASGFTASMYSKDNTNLLNAANSAITIPTLNSSTTRGDTSNFVNKWGYSLGNSDGETDAGNDSSNYHPMDTSNNPISVLTGTTSGTQNIYFGTRTDMSQASGVYTGTVVISVVTGTISDNNPITPTNPATPNAATPNATTNTAAYTAAGGANGSTVYTYSRTNGSGATATTTTTTQVSDGDNTSAYEGYTPPQGETERVESNITENSSPLATGLAVTSAVAAGAGIGFFILAKRREDDDEEQA